MKKSKLPRTDSIRKLADFWNTHDLTDFEDELEEVKESVFAGGDDSAIQVPLESRRIKEVQRIAQIKGLSPGELVRAWVLQKLSRRNPSRPGKR